MGLLNFENEAGKKEAFADLNTDAFPRLEEFEQADSLVEKQTGPADDEEFYNPSKSIGNETMRERKADAKADVIAANRLENEDPFVQPLGESTRKKASNKVEENVSYVKRGFGFNFANLERSQRKARKTKPEDDRDLEQDRRRQADLVTTNYDRYKDNRDEMDLLGWDTKRF